MAKKALSDLSMDELTSRLKSINIVILVLAGIMGFGIGFVGYQIFKNTYDADTSLGVVFFAGLSVVFALLGRKKGSIQKEIKSRSEQGLN